MRSMLPLSLASLLMVPHSPVVRAAPPQPMLLAQFPPSVRIENLAILPNGTVVVCNAYIGDLYAVNPQEDGPSRTPDHPFVSFAPYTSAVFGLTSPAPNLIAATANNFSWPELRAQPGSNAVHLVALTKTGGVKTSTFPVPSASWLNGLTPVPRASHYLLLADCAAGALLRLDTRTGLVVTVSTDPLFAPVPTTTQGGLLLGINGVHADPEGDWLYFTNTNQALYGRIAITSNGLIVAGARAEVIARGLNGSTFDDFALAPEKDAAFLAFAGLGVAGNGIEEVDTSSSGDGIRTRMVVSWDYGSPAISQPVSAAFGRTRADRNRGTLYFATAGSYVGSNTSVGGQLFALDVAY
jgi:hypothetical protein